MEKILLLGGNFLAVFSSFLISFIVFLKSPSEIKMKYIFIFFNLTIGLWCLGAFGINTFIHNYQYALYFHRFCYVFAVLLPMVSIYFSYSMRELKWENNFFKKFIYGTTFVLLILTPTPLLLESFKEVTVFRLRQSSPGIFYYLLFLQITVGCGYCVWMLFEGIKENTGKIKNQFKIVFIGYCLSYLGGAVYFSTIFQVLKIFTFAGYIVFLGTMIIFYAIIKHRLMDIDLVWRYLLEKVLYFIFTTLLLLLGWKFLLQKSLDPYIIAIFSACVIFIPIIRSLISTQLQSFLLRKYTTVWKKLESMAASKENLYSIKDIASVLVIDIPKIMSLKKSGYYKYSESDFCYESLFSKNKNDLINFDHPLVARMKEEDGCINREYLHDSLPDDKLLKNLMEKSGFSLAYPIFSGDLIIGIVIYGEKTNNQLYHNEELEQLSSIIKKAQEQIHNVLHLEYLSNNYAEEVLQKYKTTYQMQLLRETRKIGAIRDIDDLTTHIVSLVNRSVNAEYTYLYLYDETKRVYTLQKGSKQNLNLPLFVKEEQHLMKHLRQNKDILLYDTLKKWADDAPFQAVQEAESLARQLEATIIVPLIDITLLGFLVIGNKRDEGRFTNDDFFVMSFIAD